MSVDGGAFRSLMASFPTGVAVITTLDGERRPWGLTCSSLSSVSLDPPVLLVCLRAGSATLNVLLRSGEFAVNLLHDGGRPAAESFAFRGAERFDEVHWTADALAAGPHLPDAAHSVADCRVQSCSEVGDHVVVFGEVTRVSQSPGTRPLMYGLREFSVWPGRLPSPAVPALRIA